MSMVVRMIVLVISMIMALMLMLCLQRPRQLCLNVGSLHLVDCGDYNAVNLLQVISV